MHAGRLVRRQGRWAGIPGKHGVPAAHAEVPGQLAAGDHPGLRSLQASAGAALPHSPPGLSMVLHVRKHCSWLTRGTRCHLEAVHNHRPSSKAEGGNTEKSLKPDILDTQTAMQEDSLSGTP